MPRCRASRGARDLCVQSLWVAAAALQTGGGELGGQPVHSACAALVGAAVEAVPGLAAAGPNIPSRERCEGTGSWR